MHRSIFKKAAAFAALMAALVFLAACSCAKDPGTEPGPTKAPQVAYTTTHLVKYWPEDADYSTCDYSCVIELPEFSNTYTAGYSMNKAVSSYIEDLDARIENDYLKNSVSDKHHTEVTLEVEYVPGCTNVIFTEVHEYLEKPVTRTHVLMLDDYGLEMNLCDLFLDYHTAERIASLVSETAGVDTVTALSAIDVNHGAKATVSGCTVWARDGVIAPRFEGEVRFDFTFDELSPAASFEALSRAEYESLSRLLRFVSDAAVVRQENIKGGELSKFEASSFMGEYVLSLGTPPDAGRVNVPEADFEKSYRAVFGRAFPGVDEDGFDIKHEDGFYRVLYSSKPYEYHVDITEVTAAGDSVTLTGDMIFGSYGYAFTSYVCHVSVVLERSAESPFGFRLVDFTMSI